VFYMDIAKLNRDIAYVANGYIHMLQVSIPNVSFVFSDICCTCVYLDVAYVSHICFKCFI
jgi:hypothetical protein